MVIPISDVDRYYGEEVKTNSSAIHAAALSQNWIVKMKLYRCTFFERF